MHHQKGARAGFGLDDLGMRKGLQPQPVGEFVAVLCGQQFAQAVLAAHRRTALVDREKVQVVIAENDDQRIIDFPQEPQGVKRLRAAVDQVAHAPEPVFSGGKADFLQQFFQRLVTALYIPDRVGAHVARLVNRPRRRKQKHRNRRVETLARARHHAIAAMHGSRLGLDDRATAVLEGFPGVDYGL